MGKTDNGQLSLIPLPPSVIVFEGKVVKPTKAGFYKCPFKCGPLGFPQPKWKTEKGFRAHMLKCSKRPSLLRSEQIDSVEDERVKHNEELWKRLEGE